MPIGLIAKQTNGLDCQIASNRWIAANTAWIRSRIERESPQVQVEFRFICCKSAPNLVPLTLILHIRKRYIATRVSN